MLGAGSKRSSEGPRRVSFEASECRLVYAYWNCVCTMQSADYTPVICTNRDRGLVSTK